MARARPRPVYRAQKERKVPVGWFKCLVYLTLLQVGILLLAVSFWIPSQDSSPLGIQPIIMGRVVDQNMPSYKRLGAADQPTKRQFVDLTEIYQDDGQKALDDPYNRTHFPAGQRAVLIIGGSDGSGTRAFVQSLKDLGVPIVFDDEVTLDVHGRSMADGGGWPQIVSMVLDSTHSATYNVTLLPKDVKETALFHLANLKKELTRKADYRFPGGNNNATSGVSFGFKAPVTMLLLPLLTQVFGSVRFLHVVRDGRDVALSSNQSPVKKFYDYYYRDYLERRDRFEKPGSSRELESVMAMQLWNDWNLEALEWERNHADGKTFDYLVMRTEDLVDPKQRLDSLLHLSSFVGVHPSPAELCCLAMKQEKDMGSSVKIPQERGRSGLLGGFDTLLHAERGPSSRESDASRVQAAESRAKKREQRRRERLARLKLGGATVGGSPTDHRRLVSQEEGVTASSEVRKGREGRKSSIEDDSKLAAVNSRYGRWAITLRNRTELSILLHKEGRAGLTTFGYEPLVPFLPPHPDLSQTRKACQAQQPLYCSS